MHPHGHPPLPPLPDGSPPPPPFDQFHHASGHHWLALILLVAVLLLAALAVFYVLRMTARPRVAPVGPPAGAEALAIVQLRYARGEIDRDAFLRLSADLGGPPPPPDA